MDIQPLSFAKSEEQRQQIIFEFNKSGVAVNFGTIFLKKGTRIPEKGFTQHPQHEISYLKKGKIQMLHPDDTKEGILKSGDVVSIEALEPQAGIVLEDTEIIYFLIG